MESIKLIYIGLSALLVVSAIGCSDPAGGAATPDAASDTSPDASSSDDANKTPISDATNTADADKTSPDATNADATSADDAGQQPLPVPTGYFLVKNGEPASVIVTSSPRDIYVKWAISELQQHLQRASDVQLEVVNEQAAAKLPEDVLRIVLVLGGDLPEEGYSIRSHGNTLTFTGDKKALQWSVDRFLDTELGVRWLWPGELGTYVPEQKTIELMEIDHQGRPALGERGFRISISESHGTQGVPALFTKEESEQQASEARTWLGRHQMGKRTKLRFRHSFTHWWDKYGADHPEYFAQLPAGAFVGRPDGFQQPYPAPTLVKLRLGNPDIDDAIIAEWMEAGTPDTWNVCPNDGAGYDLSTETRAMDDPPNQDPWTVWNSYDVSLTARYVKFWNRLITKMRAINPDVVLTTYGYDRYSKPPQNGLKLLPGIAVGIVPDYLEPVQQDWADWSQAGAQVRLRPNWWLIGGTAPALPLHEQGNFFKFAQANNMIGFDFDTLLGYWATQGPLYYLIARLSVRPELSVDDVINDYASAFGNGASDIKEYLAFWEQLTNKAGYRYGRPHEGTLLYDIIKDNGLGWDYLRLGSQVLPYLYTDKVLDEAYAILARADQNAANDNTYVKQRIQFLRDGLDHLKLTRDVLELGYKQRFPDYGLQPMPANLNAEFLARSTQLKEMRHALTRKNVLWGEVTYRYEKHRHIPTVVGIVPDFTAGR